MRGALITELGGDHPVLADTGAHAVPRVLSSPSNPHAPVPPGHAQDGGPPGEFCVPDDLCPEDLDVPGGPRFVSEQDQWDAELDELLGRNRYSAVDDREWEEWHGVDQDEAEREMLRRDAPDWVFLPPGGALAFALEQTRPQAMSPIALIELMKAATRQAGWIEALKVEAIASFYRQRQAEHAAAPRPAQYDTKGRPIDPERSWHAEIALALGVSEQTVARWVTTALRLTGPLRATQTALKCGALTWGKALAIAEATADLPDAAAQAVEAHVLKRAAAQTHKNLLESLRRQVAKHRVAEDADEHRAAVAERTCKIVPLANGMAGLWIVHTADKIQQMWVAIQAMATLAKRQTADNNAATTAPGTDTATNTTQEAAAGTPDNSLRDVGQRRPGTASHDPTADPTATDAAPAPAASDTGPSTAPPPARRGPCTSDDAATTGDGAIHDAPPTAQHHADTTATEKATADPVDNARTATAPTPAGGVVKDARTAEQRRADVAADLFEHILRNGLDWLGRRLPDQHRRRPHIEVIVPASTLLGLDDDPAELTGYGPIPADLARRIATDGTWRRLLTDPLNGTVLEASTTRHDPGTLITETLLARHPVCAWPGCNRTSRDCDRDHTTPFTQTGTTNLTGLAPYCEYHHIIKDTPTWGWTTTSHPDGSITLTTPTGHRHTTVPPARGPITQQSDPSSTTKPAASNPATDNPANQTPADPQPQQPGTRAPVTPAEPPPL
ncbi:MULTISPECIES: hypothetical protein [unclassified Kribbella]|uniref:hypothetical protein n=1 Tax=unclassified Kribbella TaxID=2644121 RepID=UPI003077234F